MSKDLTVLWETCRGVNDTDAPGSILDEQCADCLNVRFISGAIAVRRPGCDLQTHSGTFTGYNVLAYFVPAQSETAAEIHHVDQSGTTKILRTAAGTAASGLTLADAISSLPQNAVYAVGNGKLYWAYDSTVNRLHVYDPATGTTEVRRVGLATPGVPSGADAGGAGTYPATARYYRAQFVTTVGGTIKLQSNLGTSLSATPSGANLNYTVSRPTLIGESENGWIAWGSTDNLVYYKLSGVIALNTSYVDTTLTSAYASGEASAEEGAFTPPPSYKTILWDGNRLVGFGVYETSAGIGLTPKPGRVYFSPVLDTTDTDDDERVSNTLTFQGWIDLSRNGGGEDRALAGPIDGQILAFQSRGVYLLIPKGQAQKPYQRITLTSKLGAVNQQSTFLGEDEAGRPCIYWLDPRRGPYRYGYGGVVWMGYDIQTFWKTVNLAATTLVGHGFFNESTRACEWTVATGSSNEPDTSITFQVDKGALTPTQGVRFGWSFGDGGPATSRCAAMLPTTIGATMSRTLSPYYGDGTTLIRGNSATATDDAGTGFQAFITSKAWALKPLQSKKMLYQAWLQATAADQVVIAQALTRNYGDLPDTDDRVSLSPGPNGETRLLRKFQDVSLADAFTFQTTLGDPDARSAAWTLDKWTAMVEVTEQDI